MRLKQGPGSVEDMPHRPAVLEDIVGARTVLNSESIGDYPEYKYMMFMLPIVLDAHTVVETGIGAGFSCRIHLEALSFLDGDRVLHTYEYRGPNDSDFGRTYQQTVDELRSYNLKTKWAVHLNMDSAQGGREWTGPKVDLLYLDSDHALQHVRNELEAWYPHMADKCVIYTDDTWSENTPHSGINVRTPGKCPADPYWAFDDFNANHPELKQLNFTYPQGKTFLFRGFGLQ